LGDVGHNFRVSQNPHDPNDKTVDQKAICANNAIQQALDYTVTFQNEGNGYADIVVIDDLLDQLLDHESLSISSSSHEVTKAEVEENRLRIVFEGIDLPGLNQVAPHTFLDNQTKGWVKFKLLTENCLDQGDKILNQASIVFSTEDPILTNIAETQVIDKRDACEEFEECEGDIITSDDVIKASPNPFKEFIKIELLDEDLQDFHISIKDQNGSDMWSVFSNEIESDEITIETYDWKEGLYVIILTNDSVVYSQYLIKF